MSNYHWVIKSPLLTEKGISKAKQGVYSFEVDPKATKYAVRKAVEDVFNVMVAEVTIARRVGQTRRYGRKGMVKKLPDKKIAFVTLKKGEISLFPTA